AVVFENGAAVPGGVVRRIGGRLGSLGQGIAIVVIALEPGLIDQCRDGLAAVTAHRPLLAIDCGINHDAGGDGGSAVTAMLVKRSHSREDASLIVPVTGPEKRPASPQLCGRSVRITRARAGGKTVLSRACQ